jgi:hypothetical protein
VLDDVKYVFRRRKLFEGILDVPLLVSLGNIWTAPQREYESHRRESMYRGISGTPERRGTIAICEEGILLQFTFEDWASREFIAC